LEQIHSSNASFRKKYGIEGNFVLFVGRFHKVKGIDVLLNAWASIQNSIKTTKLVIMGVDFGFQSEMLKMIDELGIKNSVIVIKKPPREDVLSAYSECEFLALPSRWELSPLTPLEGFSFKKPTISTTAHGIPHTITNRENAILVEPENSQKLADAILELLGDEKKKAQYGSAGYKLVQEVCNSRVMAEGMLKVYQEILADT
jgi:glycosyltransferase involved in cell wall biosynthesis